MDLKINFFKPQTNTLENPLHQTQNKSISSSFTTNENDVINNFIINEYLDQKSPSKWHYLGL